jgi:protein-tyrosine phosphatase
VHFFLQKRLVVPALPILIVILLVCLAGCSIRDAAVLAPAGPAGNVTGAPVHVISNVRYVDSVGRNFLFRGAHPVIERAGAPPEFDFEALRTAIRNASLEAGKDLPANFTLVDISLLWVENPQDNNRERAILHAEDVFFSSHPELGQLHMWPMYGTELSPSDPSIGPHREYLADHLDEWLPDPLIFRVETVRKYLEDPAAAGVSGPVVVYVHCYGGCDRTGELIGAYSLRYLNVTWEEARTSNGNRCRPDRAYDKANCNALQWYGIWLNRTQGSPLNWNADPPCYRPGP